MKENVSACPYCNVNLKRTPKGRTICPDCGQPILVYEGRLWIADERNAVRWCDKLQIARPELYQAREDLSVQFGQPASYADALWRLMNGIVVKIPEAQGRSQFYWQMARFLWEEKRDHLQVSRESQRVKFEELKEKIAAGWIDPTRCRLEIITCGEISCPSCRKLEGELFPLTVGEEWPIPNADCTHEKTPDRPRGWCRCTWGLKWEDCR